MRTIIRQWQWPMIMSVLAWPAAALRIGLWTAPTPVETLTFGLAIVCTISAIAAFATEMMMAGSGVRAEVARQRPSEQV